MDLFVEHWNNIYAFTPLITSYMILFSLDPIRKSDSAGFINEIQKFHSKDLETKKSECERN